MQRQSLQISQQCVKLLSQPNQLFKQVQFLKKLSKISINQKYRKTSLFLYCLYCIIHKFDYVQALQAIQKSQGVDQGSLLSIALCKLIRALLYSYIDKHRDTLQLIKQACQLFKSADTISLQMKNHYKRMVPIIINNLNLQNGKKTFFKYFSQLYDQLTKQVSHNDLNEQILFAIHSKIQYLKTQVDIVQQIKISNTNNQHRLRLNDLGTANRNKLQSVKSYDTLNKNNISSEYVGFSKQQNRNQKALNNIQKMISQQKSSSINSKNAFKNSSLKRKQFKNQPNPYQLNLYVDEKPPCQFM